MIVPILMHLYIMVPYLMPFVALLMLFVCIMLILLPLTFANVFLFSCLVFGLWTQSLFISNIILYHAQCF